jgi:glutathione reductase (NADPH)
MTSPQYDLITIGGGSGGVAASRRAGSYGARVALVESDRVGGTCVLRGCVPKKLLVYGSHFAEELADAAGFGWQVEGARLHWDRLIAAKDRELDRLNQIYQRMLRDAGVTTYQGRARLAGGDPHTVEVEGPEGTARITGKNVLIATGGAPTRPDIPGREHLLTSDDALSLVPLPKRLCILGGGYIAVELAGVFHAAGVQVTVLMRQALPLRGFDEDLRHHLAIELRNKGIELRGEEVATRIDPVAGGFRITTTRGELEADKVLAAVGRAPNTRGIGLEQAGVKLLDSGAVVVDEQSRTSVAGVYAVGDCTDRLNLTPVAIAEGRALVETLFNNNPMQVDHHNVPTAVFSQPPLSTVGMTENQARLHAAHVDVYTTAFRPMKNTLSGRNERTFMKVLVDGATDRVLGFHMLGPDAPEIIQGLAVALRCGVTKAQLDRTIGIHPTAAEEFVTLREKRKHHPDPLPKNP